MKPTVLIPCFEVQQPIGSFFVGAISSTELLRICEFDYRRMQYRNGYLEYLGIQRQIDPKRLEKISAFSKTIDACFPTSIVVAVDQKCVSVKDVQGTKILEVSAYDDPEDSSLSIPLDQAASIIDGQHRLKGLETSGEVFDLSVTVFVGADDAMAALIFSRVNLAQTKVNRSLAYDLFALARERSPEKTCHELAVALDELEISPFHGVIKRLGVATEGRFGETLSQATVVSGILPYLSADPDGDRDRGKRFGFWEPISNRDHSRRIFFELFRRGEDSMIMEILLNYFSAVSEKWSGAWGNSGQGVMIKRTNGFNGFCRFLRPAYLAFTTTHEIVSKEQFRALLDNVSLKNSDFMTEVFPPGTAGASKLYRTLLNDTGLSG
jgi:DGQHR domain-containing protein